MLIIGGFTPHHPLPEGMKTNKTHGSTSAVNGDEAGTFRVEKGKHGMYKINGSKKGNLTKIF